ncbi:MAG: hypothetical protein RSB76_03450 [Clostridia bacterium]
MIKEKAMATISIAIAICGILTNVLERLSWFMLLFSIIGITLSIISLKKTKKARDKQKSNENLLIFCLSIIGLVINAIVLTIFLVGIIYICINFAKYI